MAPSDVPEPFDLAQLDDLRITQRAVDSFMFHHGGDRPSAETELRTMVEDFTLRTSGRESRGGYLSLATKGFRIVLSPDREAVVAYTTEHRERTWTQVRAGIPSRIRAERQGRFHDVAQPAPAPGAPVVVEPPHRILELVDVDAVHLTWAVLGRGEALMKAVGAVGSVPDYVRRAVRRDLDDGPDVERAESGIHLVHGRSAVWIFSADLRSLIGARLGGSTDG